MGACAGDHVPHLGSDCSMVGHRVAVGGGIEDSRESNPSSGCSLVGKRVAVGGVIEDSCESCGPSRVCGGDGGRVGASGLGSGHRIGTATEWCSIPTRCRSRRANTT